MLENLHVKNLALIDETEVDFGPGLNILTGETGAGKSILMGSVALALGARYSADILRSGASSGLVELTFSVADEKIREKLREMDIFPEDGCVTLSRRLTDGRSVSRINGETVTMAALKAAASLLIDIHGQPDPSGPREPPRSPGPLCRGAGERGEGRDGAGIRSLPGGERTACRCVNGRGGEAKGTFPCGIRGGRD